MRIMFVCTGNSARSQMAEGFLRHLSHGRVDAYSAGMTPAGLNPHAVAVMRERGIDIAGQRSKPFDLDLAREMDVVITVCGHANEVCPVLPPEVQRLHWPLEDPASATGDAAAVRQKFQEVRDRIEPLVRRLLHDSHLPLLPPAQAEDAAPGHRRNQ